jgi:hypothetical protein
MIRAWAKIIDKLNETALFEMAYYRRDAKEKIIALSPPIFDHLLKLFLFELPLTREHWVSEIDNWFTQIKKFN